LATCGMLDVGAGELGFSLGCTAVEPLGCGRYRTAAGARLRAGVPSGLGISSARQIMPSLGRVSRLSGGGPRLRFGVAAMVFVGQGGSIGVRPQTLGRPSKNISRNGKLRQTVGCCRDRRCWPVGVRVRPNKSGSHSVGAIGRLVLSILLVVGRLREE